MSFIFRLPELSVFLKYLTFLALLFFVNGRLDAQVYDIKTDNGKTIPTCAGTFYDSGIEGNYSDEEENAITFQAPVGSTFKIDFSVLDIRAGDLLSAYDGQNTGSTLIASWPGSSLLTVSSTSNYITFRFVSNGSFTRPGWRAIISCNSCSDPAEPVVSPSRSEECFGADVRYSVDFHAGSSYAWTISQGSAIVVPGDGNEVDVTWDVNDGVTGIVKVEETNSCGSSSTSEIYVDIFPLPAPIISGPSVVCPGASGVSYSTSATGNSFDWVVVGGTTSGSGDNITVNWGLTGPASVSVKETDGMGCFTTTSDYIVNIEDVTPPVIPECPSDINPVVLPGTCSVTVNWTEPTAIDNCSGAMTYTSRSHAPGSSFNVGTTTVTYTFTDAAGNTSTCSFDVTVIDNEDPVAVCKDITVTLDATGDASITAADIDGGSSDNCGIVLFTLSKTSFDSGDIGINFVDLEVADAGGNTNSCTATVTVQDNADPISICKDISIFLDAAGIASITASDIDGGSTDPDGIKSLVASQTTFDCSDIGANIITLTVTDNADRTSTCDATVTVIDNLAPSITCPVNIEVGADAGICGAVVNYLSPVGIDNCSGSVTIQTAGLPSGSTFPVGTTTNTFRVTDGSGNIFTCSFTVKVNDNVKPVITLPAPPVVSAGAACQAPVPVIAVTVTDNCTASGSIVVSQSPVAGTMVPTGITVVTITATDLAGNIQTSPISLTVVDASGPIITAPANVIQNLDATCQAIIPDFLASLIVTDNCTPVGSITKTQTPAAGTIVTGVSSTNVNIQAFDAGGNVSSVIVLFTTKDVIPPVVSCKPATLNLDADGNATLIPVNIIASATDNCGSLSYSLSKSTFNCADIGTQTVTLTATDGSLNTATCDATVTIQDILPPVVNVITFNLVISDITGTGILQPSDVNSGSTDNCGAITLSLDRTTFDCTDLGTQTVTLTATDSNGNSASQTVDITVSTTLTVNNAGVNSCDAAGPFSRFTSNITGGTTPYTYFWDCIQPVNMFVEIDLGWPPSITFSNTSNFKEPFFNNAVPDGTYNIQLTVTDNKGCSVVYDFTFDKVHGIVEDNLTENFSSACIDEIKSYTVAPGATSYLWTSENGVIQGSNTSNTVAVKWGSTSPGTLTAKIVKPNLLGFSCTSYYIEHVTINPNPSPAFNAYPATACENSEYTYTLSGTFSSYAWSAPNGTITGGGTPTDNFVKVRWGSFAMGTVTVDVTNASGCHGLATANVVINSLPAATLTSSQQPLNTFCSGTSVTFTASPGGSNYNFRVDGSSVQNGASNIFTTSSLTNGQTVDVVVTNAASCSRTSSGITNTVVSFPVPALTSSQQPLNTFCAGTSVVFTAAGGTNFEFRVNGATVQNGGSPTYTTTTLTNGQVVDVVVSNAAGCSSTSAGITNTVTAAPIATLISTQQPMNTFCAGTSVTFTAGGGTSYNFRINGVSVQNGASNTFTTTSLTNGQSVDVVVSSGTCSTTSTSIINMVNPLPVATLTSSANPVCSGSSVTFMAGGGTSYNFRVNGISVQNGASSLYTTSALTDGQYIDVIVSIAGGCSSTSTGITMSVVTPPVISINYAGSPYCSTTGDGQAVTLTGPSGGSYSSTPSGLSIDPVSGAINPSASTTGLYTVKYTYFVGGGCPSVEATTSVTITHLPVATFNYPDSPHCSTDSDPLPSFSGGGIAGIFTSVQPGIVFISTATGQIDLSASTPGTYDIVNTIAPSAGCAIVSSSNKITIATPPTATISYAGSPFCTSVTTAQAVTLTGSGAYSGGEYSYTGPGTLSINITTGSIIPSTSSPGTYNVTYTIPAGPCSSTPASTSVTITAAKTATISYSGSPYCTSDGTGKTVTFGGDAGGTFTAAPVGLSIDASGTINPSLSAAGNYVVSYTIPAGSGCAAVIATAPVTITAMPTASISYPGAPYCSSAAGIRPVTLAGTGAYTGGSFTYTGAGTLSLNNTSGAITPSSSTPGTYDITYTSIVTSGCGPVTATTSVVITAMPSATISYGGNPFCTTVASSQPVTLIGTAGGTFSASPAGLSLNATSGAIIPSTSTPATYTVTYSIPATAGCSAFSTSINVTITALPTVSISYAGGSFCTSMVPVTVTITGTGDYLGGVFSSTAGLNIDPSTGVIDPALSIPNTYNVTYDTGPSGGCASVFANTSVTIKALPTITGVMPGSRCGAGTFILGAAASSGTINWYADGMGGSSLGTGTSFTTPIISSTTSYWVDATDASCTTAARTEVVATVNPLPTVTVNSSTVCAGTSATVTATPSGAGPYTYVWTVPGGVPAPGDVASFTTTVAGTYSVIITDIATTCSSVSASGTVTVNPLPTVTVNSSDPDNTFCAGTSITFTATGGTSYDFRVDLTSVQSGASSTYTTNTLTNGQTVDVIVSDGTCSVATPGINNIVHALPSATLTSSDADYTFCTGTSVTFTAGGGTSYDFRVDGVSVQNSASTTYTTNALTNGQTVDVIVSDGTCSATAAAITNTVNAILPVSVTITANANPVCAGASVSFTATPVNGGTSPSYQWYNGATAVGTNSPTYIYTPSDGDVIKVVLTSSESCASGSPATSNLITVAVNTPVTVTHTTTNILCNGVASGAIDITPAGGTAPYTFAWTGTGVSSTSEDQTGLAAGTYSVTVMDAASCVSVPQSITLSEPSALTGTIVSQTPVSIFGGNNGSVEVAGSGGTAPYQYRIGTGAYQATGLFTTLAAGTYSITVQDVNNCSVLVPVTITQPSAALSVSVTSQTNVTCFGTLTGTVTVAGSGGVAPYQYRIDGGAWQNSGTFGTLGAGNHTVTVADGVSTTEDVSVTILSPTEAVNGTITSQSDVLCFGGNTGSVTVAGSGGTGPYRYGVDGGTYQLSATFSLAAGTHVITVIDDNLCTFNISVIISEPASALRATITAQNNISCYGAANGSVTVAGSGGTAPYQYSIDGGAFQATGTFNSLLRGSHNITVRDANNCTQVVPATISEPDALVASETHTDVMCPDDPNGSITLTITGGVQPYNIIWADGVTGANRSGVTDGVYSAVITDQNACATSVNVTVGVIGSEDCIEIPEIITPNGDGYNDTWRIRNIDMFPNAEVVVFNRWGKKVFESRNVLATPWDGTIKGKQLPPDSYHYILDLNNGSKPRSGVISIIK